jgi:hypothetical protein
MLAGCVLLTTEGCNFHPGPPDGPDFDGLVSFMVLKEALAGTGAFVNHPDVEEPIPVAFLFIEARKALGTPDMEGLHLFIQPEDEGKWAVSGGGFVMPTSGKSVNSLSLLGLNRETPEA